MKYEDDKENRKRKKIQRRERYKENRKRRKKIGRSLTRM